MSVTRNRFLSTFSVAWRFITVEHAGVARTHMQCASTCHKNSMWRTIGNNVRMAHSMVQPWQTWQTSKEESREMMAVWPDVVRDLTDMTEQLDIPDVTKWIAKALQYNVPGGKKNRGLTVVHAYKLLASSDDLTEDNIRLARILGWCMELMQAFFLILDDIQDESLYRRNQPCWYRHNDIGLMAINDSIIIENFIYYLLQKHFKGKECYVDLLEVFHDSILKTALGQSLDILSTGLNKTSKLDLFTMDRYNSIVKYKASYYTFILPITAAMYFAKIKDPEIFRQTKTILMEMGHFFQVQDDYLGCYGELETTGKNNNDIEEGKCTWLVVVALQRVTKEQRQILEECYGSKEEEKVERVRQLYNDLGLSNMYSIYEEETYNLLNTHIQQISRGLPHDLFLNLLKKLYRRTS